MRERERRKGDHKMKERANARTEEESWPTTCRAETDSITFQARSNKFFSSSSFLFAFSVASASERDRLSVDAVVKKVTQI